MKIMQNSLIFVAVMAVAVGGTLCAEPRCAGRDGSLDMTFGSHGTVITDMGSDAEQVNAIVVLPCGRIVAAGPSEAESGASDFALAGYTSFGDLDAGFGTGGKVFTDLATVLNSAGAGLLSPSTDTLSAAVLQRDCNGCADLCTQSCNLGCNQNCNILAVGTSNANESNQPAVAVARYKCDGTLDTTFGFNNSGVTVIPVGLFATVSAVAIQKDNKIVIVGSAILSVVGGDVGIHFLVMRLNCDGTLDQTFGCDHSGIVLIEFGGTQEIATAVKIQQDGKIVVAGVSGAIGSLDFALVRLTQRGALDTHFGPDGTGKVLTDFSGNNTSRDFPYALVLTEECVSCFDCKKAAKIIVVGDTDANNGVLNFALAGYTEDGCLDREFGLNHTGLVITSFEPLSSSTAFAAVLQKDCTGTCKLVAAGSRIIPGFDSADIEDFALARYSLGGVLDRNFGIGGKVVTHFGPDVVSRILALASQENGDLVAGGVAIKPGIDNGFQDFALARYKICTSCCADVCAAGCAQDCGGRL